MADIPSSLSQLAGTSGNSSAPAQTWTPSLATDGIVTYRLSTWTHFFDFLETTVFQTGSNHAYIWRGQRRSDWSLSPSLDRLFEKANRLPAPASGLEVQSSDHLHAFKYASRGRRGANPQTLTENEWWALGQHYGLATPLLDWTRSPFAAAYFAFAEDEINATEHRVIYGLDRFGVAQRNKDLDEGPSFEKGRLPIIEFVDPMLDENQRLVSQGGLFTRSPIGAPIEQWVAMAFEGSSLPYLLRIEIPDTDRLICLRTLNRMNINHLSLFPDLVGASRFTNLKMELGL